jgi:pimeloyl-ACP methyl ester carboxylesterase
MMERDRSIGAHWRCRCSPSAAEKAFGANVAVVMRNAATNVQELVVPNAGHWLMEEAPAATIAAVQDFLAAH